MKFFAKVSLFFLFSFSMVMGQRTLPPRPTRSLPKRPVGKPSKPTPSVPTKPLPKLPEPPKPIKVPVFKKASGSLYKTFGVAQKIGLDDVFLALLQELTKHLGPLYFSKIPVLNQLPLPQNIKSFFDKLVMKAPRVTSDGAGGFVVRGGVNVFGFDVDANIIVRKDAVGATAYAIVIHLPSNFRFSQLFPKTKHFNPGFLDTAEYSTAWLALATKNMKVSVVDRELQVIQPDQRFEHEIRAGLNIFGRIRAAGPVFDKIDRLFRGRLKEAGTYAMHGVIGLSTRLIGTMIQIDLTDGITFTNWLKTTPLKFIIAIEEEITQTPAPAIAIRGGLKVLFPLQKKPVTLQLTGKYSFPEDIEWYAQMEGWLRDVPIPGLHIGNVRIGSVIDLILLAESIELAGVAGWLSGFNVAGSLGIENSVLGFAIKGGISGDTGIGDLTLMLHGSVRLRDIVGLWARYLELPGRVLAGVKLREKALAMVPDIELENFRAAFVPRQTIEFKKRIEATIGKINLFGLQGSGSIYLSELGVRGFIQLPEITIGSQKKPLFRITGSGAGGRKGPVFDIQISPVEQSMFAESFIESSLFGGIRQGGRLSLSSVGFELASVFMFMGMFEAGFHAKAAITRSEVKPENLFVNVTLKQSGLDKLSNIMAGAAKELLGDLQEKLEKLKEKALRGFGKKMERAELKATAQIARIEKAMRDKKSACNKKYSGLTIGLRPACYVWKGIPTDTLKLLHLHAKRDVSLRVVTMSGKVGIISSAKLGKIASTPIAARPIGQVMKFLSKIIKNVVNVRHFEIESSSDKLLTRGESINLKRFSARILGKDIDLKDIEFDLHRMKDFVLALYDRIKGDKKGMDQTGQA